MKPALSTIFASPFLDLTGLKRAVLYFDQVNIPSRMAFNGYTLNEETSTLTRAEALIFLTPETVVRGISALVRENIVNIVDFNADPSSDNKVILVVGGLPQKLKEETRRVLSETSSPGAKAEIALLASGSNNSLWLTDIGKDNYLEHLSDFYCEMYLMINNMVRDHNIPLCTDSIIFSEIVRRAYDDERFLDRLLGHQLFAESREAILAQKIMELYLPDLQNAPIDSILEARRKLGDELGLFRVEVAALASSMQQTALSSDTAREAERMIKSTVAPAVEDLKSKIKMSSDRIFLTVFKNLQSPASYIPFLGSAFSDLSLIAAGFASIWLAAGQYGYRDDH